MAALSRCEFSGHLHRLRPRVWAGRICVGQPAWTLRAWPRSRSRSDWRDALNRQLRQAADRVRRAVVTDPQSLATQRCRPRRDPRAGLGRPMPPARLPVAAASCSREIPPSEKLGSRQHRMNDRCTVFICDDAHLKGSSVRGRSDEHGDCRIVGVKGSPLLAIRVVHVFVSNAVLASGRLNLH